MNLRCPHLSWYTMKGEAKRDYPASMLHQSCWYRDYHYVEDYFSRIHAALHDGKPVCDLLVLNPIESVWARAYSGSFDGLLGVDSEIIRLERQYAELFHILSGNQIDFDYGEEDITGRWRRVSCMWEAAPIARSWWQAWTPCAPAPWRFWRNSRPRAGRSSSPVRFRDSWM